MSHWKYKGEPFDEIPNGFFVFVYRITHKKSGKKYIGRKYFHTTRRKPLTKRQKKAGRKRRDIIRKESDWREYTGSSKVLNEMIEKNPKGFDYEILALGKTKGQVNLLEELLHWKYNVLFDDSYINDSVGARRYIGVKIDEEFKQIVMSL